MAQARTPARSPASSAAANGLTLPLHAVSGVKGGWLAVTHLYTSEMAQNFWTAIWAWSSCFVVTILVSLVTRARDPRQLVGLVYSLTARVDDSSMAWYLRPGFLGLLVLAAAAALNVIFW